MLPPGEALDVSCLVETGPYRFAAAYEGVGASDDHVVGQAWACDGGLVVDTFSLKDWGLRVVDGVSDLVVG